MVVSFHLQNIACMQILRNISLFSTAPSNYVFGRRSLEEERKGREMGQFCGFGGFVWFFFFLKFTILISL